MGIACYTAINETGRKYNRGTFIKQLIAMVNLSSVLPGYGVTGKGVTILPGIASQRRREMKSLDKSIKQPAKLLMKSVKEGKDSC